MCKHVYIYLLIYNDSSRLLTIYTRAGKRKQKQAEKTSKEKNVVQNIYEKKSRRETV